MEERVANGLDADSPFEEDVATAIRSLGYLADPQVGTAGFRIDLGVRHPDRPGQYLLAVECDGAAYHAALWARERDRLRQMSLKISAGISIASGAPTGFIIVPARFNGWQGP